MVELVKKNVKATTLAIGDGANDVSMIKGLFLIGLFQLKSVSPTLRISDIRGISQFKARAEIQGVITIQYVVEDIGHPGGPSSIYSRGYRTSRGFFKNF